MRKIVCALILGGLLIVGSEGFCQVSAPGLFDRAGQGSAGTERSIWNIIGPPTLHASWAALGSITATASASAGFGQSFSAGIPAVLFLSGNVSLSGNGDARLQYDARGLWLGATIPVRLSNALTLRARGEYFFPFRQGARVSVDGAGFGQGTTTLFLLGAPVGTLTASGTGQSHLDLDTSVKTRWWVLDAEAEYSSFGGGTGFLAGVRYDRLETTISPGTGSASAGGSVTIAAFGGGGVTIAGSASDVGAPTAASVIAELDTVTPYLGIRTSTGGPFRALTCEVKGFPTVFFAETRLRLKRVNGYFGEFKAEHSGSLASNLSASVFVKGDVLHATFAHLTDFTNLFTIGGFGLPAGPFFRSQSTATSQVSPSVHWSQLSVGGSVVLSF